jgi:hypothetical protein
MLTQKHIWVLLSHLSIMVKDKIQDCWFSLEHDATTKSSKVYSLCCWLIFEIKLHKFI